MATDDYGFRPMDPAGEVRTDAYPSTPEQELSPRAKQRQVELASWWLEQLQLQLKRCMMRPSSADQRRDLNALLDDYLKHVQSGSVKPPRFSLD